MENIYEYLGIPTIINASGSMTELGGSVMTSDVAKAMAEASQYYIHLPTLKSTLEDRVAKMLEVEAVHFCSGASAGIILSAAACMTGTQDEAIKKLPRTNGIPNVFLTPEPHRNKFDHAIQVAGGEIQTFNTDEAEFKNLLANPQTVAVYFTLSWFCKGEHIPISRASALAKQYNKPVIIDAAAQVPPIENFKKFLAWGGDLVIFSGGKTIKGPQVSGFIAGNKRLIKACHLNNSPNIQTIGRGMKLSKEEIVALFIAIEKYLKHDHESDQKRWNQQLKYIQQELDLIAGLERTIKYPYGPGYQVPYLELKWLNANGFPDAHQLLEDLKAPPYRIYARFQAQSDSYSSILVYAHTLKENEEIVISEKLRVLLS